MYLLRRFVWNILSEHLVPVNNHSAIVTTHLMQMMRTKVSISMLLQDFDLVVILRMMEMTLMMETAGNVTRRRRRTRRRNLVEADPDVEDVTHPRHLRVLRLPGLRPVLSRRLPGKLGRLLSNHSHLVLTRPKSLIGS